MSTAHSQDYVVRPGEKFDKTEFYESGACVNFITNKNWPNWLSDTVKNGYWHLSGRTMQTGVYNVSYTLVSRSMVSSGRGRPPRCQPTNYYNRKFTIAVVNKDPIIHSNPPHTIGEGQNKTYVINATDADNDPLTYSITNAPPFIDINGEEVVISPNYHDAGHYRDIVIIVKDSYGGKGEQSFDLIVSNTDRVPRFESSPPKVVQERERYEYSINAIDPDGSTVSLSLVKAPNFLILDGNFLSGRPGWNGSGNYQIKIKASSKGGSRIQSYSLHVSNRNREPYITSTPNKSVKEGSSYTYKVTASDPDGTDVTYSLEEGPGWSYLNGNKVHGTPGYNASGTYDITVAAHSGGQTVQQSYILTVVNINRRLKITSTPDRSVIERDKYTYKVTAKDPDGTKITFSLKKGPEWLSFSGNILQGIPGWDAQGSHTVIVVAHSGGQSVHQSYKLAVQNIDRPPEFHSSPDKSAEEGKAYSYKMNAPDPDGTDVRYSTVNGPRWLSVKGSNLTGVPSYDASGSYAVKVKASSSGKSDTQSFTLSVSNNNRKLHFTSTPDLSVTERNNYNYKISAQDPDGTGVTYKVRRAPNWLRLTGNELHGTPGWTDSGKYDIVIAASSGGQTVIQSYTLTVKNNNRSPKFISEPVTIIEENQNYVYDMKARDPDGDELRYSMVKGPGFLLVNRNRLKGTPDNSSAGKYNITIKVSDSKGGTDTQSFTLTVKRKNRKPSFTSDPVTQAKEGGSYSYIVTTSDPDNDPLTLKGIKIPGFLSLKNNKNGKAILTGKLDYTTSGSYEIILSVTDGIATVKQKFMLTVSGNNRAPKFTSKPVKYGRAKLTYRYNITASDPDGQNINISYTQGPNWLQIRKEDPNAGTAILTGEIPANGAGKYDITLKASDGRQASAQNFTLTVTKGNGPPVFTSKPVKQVVAGKRYSYQITTNDKEGNNVTIFLKSGPEWLKLTGVNPKKGVATLLGQPKISEKGTYTVILKAKDNGNPPTSALQQFTLTVSTNNLDPIITSNPVKTGHVGVKYTYKIVVTDSKDNLPDNLSISVTSETGKSIPNFLKVQAASSSTDKIIKVLTGTPGKNDNGKYSIRIIAKDNHGGKDVQKYTLTIAKGNKKPVFNSSPDVNAVATEPYKYEVKASDPDGDKVSLSATLQNGKSLPGWLSFDSSGNTGVLYGTPKPSDVGRLNIVIKARDNGKPPRVRKQRFALTISHKPVSGIQVYFVYPTSCRNKCTIKFAVPSRQYVYLEVSSAAGEIVRTTQKEMYHKGINKLIFKPRMLPTGRYYFILHGEGISYRASISIVN